MTSDGITYAALPRLLPEVAKPPSAIAFNRDRRLRQQWSYDIGESITLTGRYKSEVTPDESNVIGPVPLYRTQASNLGAPVARYLGRPSAHY